MSLDAEYILIYEVFDDKLALEDKAYLENEYGGEVIPIDNWRSEPLMYYYRKPKYTLLIEEIGKSLNARYVLEKKDDGSTPALFCFIKKDNKLLSIEEFVTRSNYLWWEDQDEDEKNE